MISVYFNDNHVRVVQANVTKNKIFVKKFMSAETEGANTDSNTLKDTKDFAQKLQGMLDDGEIKDKKLFYVADNARIVMKEMDLPAVDEKKLKVLLANEVFPDGKLANNVLDYIVNDIYVDEETKKKRCKLDITFINKDIIKELQEVAMDLGLKPLVVDIAPNAMAKLISLYAPNEIDDEFVLLDYKKSFISIYVFSKGKRLFSKSTVLYARPTEENDAEFEYFFSELCNNLSSVEQYASDKYECNVQNIYVTGDISVIKNSLQQLADHLVKGVKQLPVPSILDGMDVQDFNVYGTTVGALIRR
ncbi:MAG: hypothetical protein RR123_01070 [Clostridia bacterium]